MATERRSGEVDSESGMAWETKKECRSGESEQGGLRSYHQGLYDFTTLKALSGYAFKLVVGDLPPVSLSPWGLGA